MIIITTFQHTGRNMLRTFDDESAARGYEGELRAMGYTPMRGALVWRIAS